MFDFFSNPAWMQAATAGASLFGAIGTASAQRQGGAAARAYGDAQAAMAEHDAAQEADAARALAQKILRAAAKQKGSARANTAASGARLDEWSTGAEEEIEQLAQEDAAMTILSGKRRGDSLRFSGRMAQLAGNNEAAASRTRANTTLFQGLDSFSRGMQGWRGAKGPEVVDDGYSMGIGGAYGGSRRGM